MVKLFKSFRKQADKAAKAANRARDPEMAAELQALASAYRSQADVLKQREKLAKRSRSSR
jgi:hypothetical protein